MLPLDSTRALSIAYMPGVAQVSRAIAADPAVAASHARASRLVIVVSDGTAVLGLGDIGPAVSLPVMEGKAALRLRPSYGAVNLEDISAPHCFELRHPGCGGA
ncbi:malic enzyme [Arthrobacter sp. UYP6]